LEDEAVLPDDEGDSHCHDPATPDTYYAAASSLRRWLFESGWAAYSTPLERAGSLKPITPELTFRCGFRGFGKASLS
jgi:hypothetical protein